MADRNDYRGDRRPRWSSQQGERGEQQDWQHEQFETGNRSWGDDNGSQMGEQGFGRGSDRYQGGRDQGSWGSQDRSRERSWGGQGQNWSGGEQHRYGSGGGAGGSWNQGGQQRGRDAGSGYSTQDYGRYPSDFDATGYRTQGRGYGSFTGNDFGGRDFTGASSGWAADTRGGYAGGAYGASSSGAYTGSSYDNDRGFLERAGDRIASWFGDDDNDRSRTDRGHRGRGPSNYTRSDQRILEDACDRITDDWRVDGTKIQVTVENGEVTLDGTVRSRDEKRRAEDCVDHISGVKHVQNNLRIDASSTTGSSTTGSSGTSDDTLDDKPAPFI